MRTISFLLFSDESRFQLCPDDHRRRVWRRPGQRADPDFTIAHHTGPQPELMVWDAISFDGWTSMVILRGTLTAQRCVDDFLRTVLLPFLLQYLGLIVQKIRADHMCGTFCYELSYTLSNTSLSSQIARFLFNQAYLGYDEKATASTREC
ncbi:transposable element Tc1 transposase [Trichonephila clavipes]|nr:transposable element Tc1 transposase [Trichonephila clavipes]